MDDQNCLKILQCGSCCYAETNAKESIAVLMQITVIIILPYDHLSKVTINYMEMSSFNYVCTCGQNHLISFSY